MAKKIHTDEIDESFIIASIKQEKKAEATAPVVAETLSTETDATPKAPEVSTIPIEAPEPSKPNKRGKGKLDQYEELFFKESEESARLGKGITIRPEFHDNITEILHLIGDNSITLFSYVDNILAHHFETYESELNELYDRRYKKPKFLNKKS